MVDASLERSDVKGESLVVIKCVLYCDAIACRQRAEAFDALQGVKG